jgi:hypothetical protein
MLVHWMAIWYILWQFGIFCGNLVHFMAKWYILWPVSIFFPVSVCCTKKTLATLELNLTVTLPRTKIDPFKRGQQWRHEIRMSLIFKTLCTYDTCVHTGVQF